MARRSWISSAQSLVRLGRPQFLLYSGLLVTLGSALAVRLGHSFSLTSMLRVLVLVWTNHLITHYVNEFFDLEADRANLSPTSWTGGSRVLVDGHLSPKTAIYVAVALSFLSVVQALTLEPHVRSVAWAGLVLAWGYTAPPLRLNYRGLGELTVATVLLLLVPLIAAQIQGVTDLAAYPWPFLVPAFLVQLVRMGVMNMADRDGDVRVGKRTAVVRMGLAAAERVHALGQGLALAWAVVGAFVFEIPTSLVVLLLMTSPLAVWQVVRVLRGDHQKSDLKDSVVFWATNHSALVVLATLGGILIDIDRSSISHATLAALLVAPTVLVVLLAIRIFRALRP